MAISLAASIILPGLISYGISECVLSIREAKLTKFLEDMNALRNQHKQAVETYTRYLGQRDYQMQANECPGHSDRFPKNLVGQRLTQGCQAVANYPTESRRYAAREKALLTALMFAFLSVVCAVFCFRLAGVVLWKHAALSVAMLASGLLGASMPFGSAFRVIAPSYRGPFASLLGLKKSEPLPRLLYTPDMIIAIGIKCPDNFKDTMKLTVKLILSVDDQEKLFNTEMAPEALRLLARKCNEAVMRLIVCNLVYLERLAGVPRTSEDQLIKAGYDPVEILTEALQEKK